ncbi:hypothetical protein PB01_20590 [Psychrobacillus glaciei]|uniref:Uncharacterized protein n=1 Tax=Psychrobacillus glaciei TaxID=2283160 RepID=A0A5J6SXF3_9BACI|nr:hypothetical protein [Psychrobacillus glaciei]QFG00998.1 hypothetical protein PB01_20590 [Psychrobacillus glaciei]
MERLKTGIDEVIGEKLWMTEDLARKMAQPRKKSTHTPIYAMVSFVSIAALFLTITLWPAQLGILSTATTKELGVHGELFNTYFEAIDAKDAETLNQVASPAYGATVEELYNKYEHMDFSKAEFLSELDGIIWMKFVVLDNEGEKWDDVVTYYQIVDGKIYDHVYDHPFYIYKHFDMEEAQAQAVFGFGGYRNNSQFVAINKGKLLVSGSRSYNKMESTIELYLKEIGEESMFEQYQHPRLVYKDNGKVLQLSADGFDITFTREGERILVDNQGVEYYQQGRY